MGSGEIWSDSPLKKKISPRMLATASKLPSHRSGMGREGLQRKGEVSREGLRLLVSLLNC